MIRQIIARFAAGLRFPTLFALTATLFVVDLFVPDLIPFLDEVLLALGTLLFASLRRRRGGVSAVRPSDTEKVVQEQ